MREQHLLTELVFPSRYEPLRRRVGTEVARLLVSPDQATSDAVESIAYAIQQTDEGLLCPMYAVPGTGKTTLAFNVGGFFPALFGSTLEYQGSLTTVELSENVAKHRADTMAMNDQRLTPINIDSREATPPDETEMAEIKQFLRTEIGSKTAVFWPTTTREIADDMSERYERIAGGLPVALPLEIQGPPREAWQAIAADTIRLVNQVDSLELLVDARNYDPDAFPSIGTFLRKMSEDFMGRRLQLLRSTRKPINLTVLFASDSADAGILSQLTSGSRHGFLDGNALVGVTKDGEIGKWWESRRGLLTQTIVQLDAHALCLPPTVVIPTLRLYGPEEVVSLLETAGVSRKGPGECARVLRQSDLGRHLAGERRSSYEARGRPGSTSPAAFQLIAEEGVFQDGKDKSLNKAFAKGLAALLADDESSPEVSAETQLEGTPLIPDVLVTNDKIGHCVEVAWRSGDYLVQKNRSDAASYILRKLRNYAREMGWSSD